MCLCELTSAPLKTLRNRETEKKKTPSEQVLMEGCRVTHNRHKQREKAEWRRLIERDKC